MSRSRCCSASAGIPDSSAGSRLTPERRHYVFHWPLSLMLGHVQAPQSPAKPETLNPKPYTLTLGVRRHLTALQQARQRAQAAGNARAEDEWGRQLAVMTQQKQPLAAAGLQVPDPGPRVPVASTRLAHHRSSCGRSLVEACSQSAASGQSSLGADGGCECLLCMESICCMLPCVMRNGAVMLSLLGRGTLASACPRWSMYVSVWQHCAALAVVSR